MMKKRGLFVTLAMVVGLLIAIVPASQLVFASAEVPALSETEVALSDAVPPTVETTEPGIMAVGAVVVEEKSTFTVFKGTVLELFIHLEQTVVRLEDEEGGQFDMKVDDMTVISDSNGLIALEDIAVGDKITAYYIAPQIMTLQYPPMVISAVLVKQESEAVGSVCVNVFDEGFLAIDNEIKINISDETVIVNLAGDVYEEDLVGKVLMVYYTMETRSIPPQTTPTKIIVLEDTAYQHVTEGEPYNLVPEVPQDMIDPENVPNMPIFVNGAVVQGAAAYAKEDGTVMVPVRAISEALGYEIGWDGILNQVRIGVATTISIGVNEYTIGRAAPRALEAAPELNSDDRTYVPVSFFTDIMQAEFRVNEGLLSFTALVPANSGADVDEAVSLR